jgi:DNA-binding transcriptional LysR family regulator
MVPTAAGEALLAPAGRAQAAIADAVAAVAALRSGERGRVRLGTGATACIHLLPPVLAAAKRRMPGLEVIVATGNSGDIIRRVETGELDVGLVTLPLGAGRTLSVTRLLADPLVALVPEAWAPESGVMTAARLAALPLILYEKAGTTRGLIDAWFRRAGIAPAPIMQLDSVETIKVLVGSGLGASVLPNLALGGPVAGAMTRALRPAARRELALVLRREKIMDRGLRVLVEALRVAGNG